MAQQLAKTEPRRKPVLDAALSSAQDLLGQLVEVSRAYQFMKATVENDDVPTDVGLMLVMGSMQIPMPMPDDNELKIRYAEEATAFLGAEVIRLWNGLHQVTTEAAEHCAAAAVKSQQA